MLSKLRQFLLPLVTGLLSLTSWSQVTPSSADERLKGLQQRRILEEKSILNSIQFRNIGPAIMSGRVVDLDVNPEDPT